MSPARMVIRARGLPSSLSPISQTISSLSCKNHSIRSLPWTIGRMNSSVVGQNRLVPHTEVTDGFQLTSERDRYLYRLKACSWPSKPSAACTSGSSWATSAKWRLTGRSSRSGESPSKPGMRRVATRKRSIASMLSPFLRPNAVPVSLGAANGSKPALVQSRRIDLKVAMICGVSNCSV
ncbi:hypothetical protein D3C86_1468590 [compost metagenome]